MIGALHCLKVFKALYTLDFSSIARSEEVIDLGDGSLCVLRRSKVFLVMWREEVDVVKPVEQGGFKDVFSGGFGKSSAVECV